MSRSPERLEGKPYNSLSDIWSFGILLYELASGEYPYQCNKNYIELMQTIKNQNKTVLPEKF
jgi:serine/threonine protein kinase